MKEKAGSMIEGGTRAFLPWEGTWSRGRRGGQSTQAERKEGTGREGRRRAGLECLITLCNVMGIALGGPSYFNYLALRNCDCKVNFITLSFNEPNMGM